MVFRWQGDSVRMVMDLPSSIAGQKTPNATSFILAITVSEINVHAGFFRPVFALFDT